MAINILDSAIANRISAGEVVERPASIVKELVDNSIDAGATNILVQIRNGGIDYIKVTDNGTGIEENDLKKAFLPHATSKIKTIDDLDNIWTLGFRGEALASIVSVSKVTMTTKTIDGELGNVIEVNGGEFGTIKKIASNIGTSIEVKNLFYNTPARRKFLRKPKQEESEITNVMTRYILAKPNIKFKYIVEDNIVFFSSGQDLLSAISCVYNGETAQNILPIEVTSNNIHIYGYVSKLSYTKPNTTYQTLLVNGRYVVDETVSKAVYMAFEEFLMSRQFPFFVINIDLPYTDVDVNVHPNKLSIKFSKPSVIFDLVYSAVRKAITSFVTSSDNYSEIKSDLPEQAEEIEIETTEDDRVVFEPEVFDKKITFKQSVSSEKISFFDKVSTEEKLPKLETLLHTEEPLSNTSNNVQEENVYQPITDFSDYKIIGELFNEFLLLEKDEKMLLIDFHAGHERLLYDELVKKAIEKQIVIQDLLIPYVQAVNSKEMDYLLEFKDELESIGFGLDQFSPTDIRISYVPVLMKDINLKNFVYDLLNDMNNYKPKVAYELDSYLMRTACRSAVKAGEKLSEMQIKALLKNLDINKPVLLCPHGRPIVTVVTKAQIEKWFKRIV